MDQPHCGPPQQHYHRQYNGSIWHRWRRLYWNGRRRFIATIAMPTGNPIVPTSRSVQKQIALNHFTEMAKWEMVAGVLVCGSPTFDPSSVEALPMTAARRTSLSKGYRFFDDYSVVNHTGASWTWTFPGASYVSSTTVKIQSALSGSRLLRCYPHGEQWSIQ